MITSIDLAKLRNAEYIQFIKGFSALVLSNDPAALKVQAQYNLLQTQLASLEAIFVTEQGSAITEEVSAFDLRRDRAVTGFGLLVTALTYHFNPDTAKQAETLKKLVDKYGGGIARENYQAETAIIDNLVADLDNKPEMAAALAALQLGDWKKEMATANAAFDTAYMQRTKELGAASKDTLLALRAATNEAWYKLRDFIVSFYTINEAAEPYNKTINELNAHIDQYNTMMAGRLSNGKDKGKDEPPAPPAA